MNFLKKIGSVLLIGTIIFSVSACKSGESLLKKGSVEREGVSVFAKPERGFVGDPSPFFDGEKLNVYFIFDARAAGMFHPWHLYQTDNGYTWDYKGLTIPTQSISEQDYGIGTGTVLAGKDGLYHAFYTGWNGNRGADVDFVEKVQHATSTDLMNWTKHPEDGFYGGYNDFRDPNVTYIPELDEYWMQVSSFYEGRPALRFYKSKNLKTWENAGVFFDQGKDGDFMECPTLIQYNGWWYLAYFQKGVDGTNTRVTRYLYKKNITDPEWIEPPTEFIDGAGFSAGRLVNFKDGRLLAVGWCGTKIADWDAGDFTWAGNLVMHEILQNEDGTLYAAPVKEVEEVISTEVGYKQTYKLPEVGYADNTIIFPGEKNYEFAFFDELESKPTKMTFEIEADSGQAGMTFDRLPNSAYGNLTVLFDFDKTELQFYNKRPNGLGNVNQAYVKFPRADKYVFTVLSEGECMTLYVNDQVALTTRMYKMAGKEFAFFSLKNALKIENLHFYE